MKIGSVAGLTLLIPSLFIIFSAAPARPEQGETVERLREGKAAFESECKKCHSIKLPLAETRERSEWKLTVNMMVSNGAQLSDDQKTLIVDYLSAKSLFETKCSVCHGTDRPLSKAKSPADWLSTVQRMGGKKPGHLTESDVEEIASWLALERPAE